MNLGITRVAHACRKKGRGGGRISRDGRTTRWVNKWECRRVQQGRRVRRASTTKDTATLSTVLHRGHIDVSTRGLGRCGYKHTYMASLDEGEGLAAEEGVTVGSINVLLPEIAGLKHGQVLIGCGSLGGERLERGAGRR